MTPKLKQPDDTHHYMLLEEAFMQRAALVGGPFMLKGSYVLRQYLPQPEQRLAFDLDWVCLSPAADIEQMRGLLDAWATAVSEQAAPDGFSFQTFRKNSFWRMIDYAMSDDFPTVNTDICGWLPGYDPAATQGLSFAVDVSFNLAVEPPPVPLTYRPLRGEPFELPSTCPLALQVAWKLHQTLVRPRYKDISDLLHLLALPAFDASVRAAALQALVDECGADRISPQRLRYYVSGDAAGVARQERTPPVSKWQRYFSKWLGYRPAKHTEEIPRLSSDQLKYNLHLGAGGKPYATLPELFDDFRAALNRAGITPEAMDRLPAPKHTQKGHVAEPE